MPATMSPVGGLGRRLLWNRLESRLSQARPSTGAVAVFAVVAVLGCLFLHHFVEASPASDSPEHTVEVSAPPMQDPVWSVALVLLGLSLGAVLGEKPLRIRRALSGIGLLSADLRSVNRRFLVKLGVMRA